LSTVNSFGSADILEVNSKRYRYFKLNSVDSRTLPYSLKILLETCCAPKTAQTLPLHKLRHWLTGIQVLNQTLKFSSLPPA